MLLFLFFTFITFCFGTYFAVRAINPLYSPLFCYLSSLSLRFYSVMFLVIGCYNIDAVFSFLSFPFDRLTSLLLSMYEGRIESTPPICGYPRVINAEEFLFYFLDSPQQPPISFSTPILVCSIVILSLAVSGQVYYCFNLG